jgi:hypothetical protein
MRSGAASKLHTFTLELAARWGDDLACLSLLALTSLYSVDEERLLSSSHTPHSRAELSKVWPVRPADACQ